jgi:membrane protein YqaA with SNARE-associated domain
VPSNLRYESNQEERLHEQLEHIKGHLATITSLLRYMFWLLVFIWFTLIPILAKLAGWWH